MYYETSITIPANTSRSSPEEVELKVTQGIIHRGEIEFPWGCAGLAHVSVHYQEHQIWPANPSGDIASDDHVVPIDDIIRLDSAPYLLDIRGWNDDDSYSHTLRVRVGLLRREELALARAQPSVLTRLKEVLIGGATSAITYIMSSAGALRDSRSRRSERRLTSGSRLA